MFGPNFYWDARDKINAAGPEDVENGVIFVSNKRGFTVRYLKFLGTMNFRVFTSAKATTWAYAETFAIPGEDEGYGKGILVNRHKHHQDAMLYYLTIKEFGLIG